MTSPTVLKEAEIFFLKSALRAVAKARQEQERRARVIFTEYNLDPAQWQIDLSSGMIVPREENA